MTKKESKTKQIVKTQRKAKRQRWFEIFGTFRLQKVDAVIKLHSTKQKTLLLD